MKNKWKTLIYVNGVLLATKLVSGSYYKAINWKNSIITGLPSSIANKTTWCIKQTK